MEELDVLAKSGRRFDMVVCDPPTFSNSKRMQGVFDVQRDHVELMRRVHKCTARDGTVYFSTNHRKFGFGEATLRRLFDCEELTPASIPRDFRDRKIHRCWRLRAL